jgi:hypothetical protein
MPSRAPHHLKLLRGTARRDRQAPDTPSLEPIRSLPEAPAWLSPAAREVFNRIGAALVACNAANTGTPDLLASYSALTAHIASCWSSGSAPPAALITSHRQLAHALNLTAMHLTPEQARGPVNRFAANVLRMQRERS